MTPTKPQAPRATNGRFKSQQDPNNLPAQGREIAKYKRRRKELMRFLFEGYIKVIFLKGESDDYVPFSSNSGPFVETYEKIVKGPFLLGRRTRSEILQEIYKAEEHKGFPSCISRRTLKTNGNGTKDKSRPKVYGYRRLPNPSNFSTEILPLRNWLKTVVEEKANLCSFEDAYNVCCQAMGSYRVLDGTPMFIGFLTARAGDSSSVDGDGNSSSQENHQPNIGSDRCARGSHTSPDGANGLHRCPESLNSHLPSNCPQICARAELDIGDEVLSPSHDARLSYMMQFLEIVHDDTYFRILCTLFDESLESRFYFMAGSYLEKNRRRQLEIPRFLKIILIYCHGKAFGTKNKPQHEARGRSLRSLKENAERARLISGLKSYEEICRAEDSPWSRPR